MSKSLKYFPIKRTMTPAEALDKSFAIIILVVLACLPIGFRLFGNFMLMFFGVILCITETTVIKCEKIPGTVCLLEKLRKNQRVAWGDGATYYLLYTRF